MHTQDDTAALVARTPLRRVTLAVSVLAGMAVGCVCVLAIAPPRGARFEARLAWSEPVPATRDWPRPAREGESAHVEGQGRERQLVVTSGSAASARLLARTFAAQHTPAATDLAARLVPVREGWRRAAPAAPARTLANRARPTECAALLLARARWGEELANELPVALPVGPARAPNVPVTVGESWLNVSWAAEERDPQLLRQALHDATRADSNWFTDRAAWSGWPVTEHAQAWRDWQHSRAQELETLASGLMELEGRAQRQALESAAAAALVLLDERAGDPWGAFAVPDAQPARPLVRPVLSVWLPPLLLGAGAGSLAGLLVVLIAVLLQPVFPRSRALREPYAHADPAAITPLLHVVTGARPALVARAALELAAHRVAFGDRVLLVDGSARLKLHERLGRDARWGLLECLATEMPVMGLVQYGGHPGLYLLPYGGGSRAVGWSLLGRKLDELQPNFGRIILAVDPWAPTELGDALRGRAMEGWWGGTDRRLTRSAEQAMGRLGIAMNPLSLSDMPEATLEAMSMRVLVLRPAGPEPEPAPITAPVAIHVPPPPQAVLEPIVLDCDLQVKQRLRFLAWMRRVRAEDHREGARVSS